MTRPEDIPETMKLLVKRCAFLPMTGGGKIGDIVESDFTWKFYEGIGQNDYPWHVLLVYRKANQEPIGGAWTSDWGPDGARVRPLPLSEFPTIESKFSPKSIQ